MRILLPTGEATAGIVEQAAAEFDAIVVVTGEIASFLTPSQLTRLVGEHSCDLVIVSGMCTASFAGVEEACGVPVFRGPRHAADLSLVLPLIGTVELSRTVPADEFIAVRREEEAQKRLESLEESASCSFSLRGLKIGGSSRIKVLAEIMDAHRHPDIRRAVEAFFTAGADIVDLGFGFDATPGEVVSCFSALEDVRGPLAVDTQDPVLIEAALGRADLVLSLQEENIPLVGHRVAAAGAAAVVVPGRAGLEQNLKAAQEAGVVMLIADPLLQPVGSGLVTSLAAHRRTDYPLFFGAGNVVELMDADSVGANALLAGMAYEAGAAVIFSSEHSDKTRGSVAEMRRAVGMMALMEGRPYPKDLGLDLLVIKEKRRRREPPLQYDSAMEAGPPTDELEYDPEGNFRIGIEDGYIVAVHKGTAIRGRHWDEVFAAIQRENRVSFLDHAAYLGKELYKAELAIRFGRSFEQDGRF